TLDGHRLVLTLDPPHRSLASTLVGGGLGFVRTWLNLEVPLDYARTDPVLHLMEEGADLSPPLIATMTAASVAQSVQASAGGAWVVATVGLSVPLAAAGSLEPAMSVGTINIAAVLDVPLTDAGLVNAVQTLTEAKAQALADGGLWAVNHDGPATGTATDSVLVACPEDACGGASSFAGPASAIGHDLALATHACMTEGLARWRARQDERGASR
ncbi:MAG TPA: adenosylcobinamide amidohydrolase, partial [Euzebya sp.]|nr:adenosylcobinamide amidohydrolase [Euzebya sp.]